MQLGIDRLGENPTEWEPVLALIFAVGYNTVRTLAAEVEVLPLISPTAREMRPKSERSKDVGGDEHKLLASLVQFVEALPQASGPFR